MAELLITPSQTIGPFFRHGLSLPGGENLFPASAPGQHIRLGGVLTDGNGQPVSDALIEFWQPDASGRFGSRREGASGGFGRVQSDAAGRYAVHTILPGQVAGPDGGMQAPHVLVVIFARGLVRHLVTRVYFDGEPANKGDAVLSLCGARAATLIARRVKAGDYDWNISLQGAGETVFFEV